VNFQCQENIGDLHTYWRSCPPRTTRIVQFHPPSGNRARMQFRLGRLCVLVNELCAHEDKERAFDVVQER
jgi:hypothetical protein